MCYSFAMSMIHESKQKKPTKLHFLGCQTLSDMIEVADIQLNSSLNSQLTWSCTLKKKTVPPQGQDDVKG